MTRTSYFGQKLLLDNYYILILGIAILHRLIIILYDEFYYWFPIDDSYIYTQFSKNLAYGHFLTYSIGEPHSNGCTSFIYYIFYSIVYIFAKSIPFPDTIALVQLMIFFVFVILYISCAKLFFKLLVYVSKPYNVDFNLIKLIVLAVLTINPIFYAFFSGLEYPFSLFFLLLFMLSIFEKRLYIFLLSVLFINLGRPEGLLLTTFSIIVLILKRDGLYINNKRAILIIFIMSALFVPIINFLYTGSPFINSVSRVNLGSFYSIVWLVKSDLNILFRLFSLPVLIPSYGLSCLDSKFHLNFILGIIYISTPFIYFREYLRKLEVFKKWQRDPFFWLASLIIAGVLAQLALPLLVGTDAEFARYTSTAYPLLIFLIIAIMFKIKIPSKKMRLFFSFMLIINILFIPIWDNHYLKSMEIINKELYPMGNYIKNNLNKTDLLALDQAGILALMNPGITIDTYGLGTMRYAKFPRTSENQLRNMYIDRPNWCITYDYNYAGRGSPSFYLRSLPRGAKAELKYTSGGNLGICGWDYDKLQIYKITYCN